MNNHLLKAFLFSLAALAIAVPEPVLADNDDYWTNLSGKIPPSKIWKNGFGECWRSGDWTQGTDDACMGEQPVVVATTMQPVAAAPEPDLDGDGDGVIDRLDHCPGTSAGKKVDINGCPDILLTLTGVNFKFDSSQIEPDSERILNQAVDELNNAKTVDIRITGHTDSTGSDAYNMALSNRRANAVQNYLVRHGIDNSLLSTDGKGESQPVASNATNEGRYQNRRVEFHVKGVRQPSASTTQPSSGGNVSSTEDWRQLDQTVVQF